MLVTLGGGGGAGWRGKGFIISKTVCGIMYG